MDRNYKMDKTKNQLEKPKDRNYPMKISFKSGIHLPHNIEICLRMYFFYQCWYQTCPLKGLFETYKML